MCDYGGFEPCELEMKDKFDYKKLLKEAWTTRKQSGSAKKDS